MKKSTFLALFIATNISFVLLHLHKQSQFIHLSYTKQKIELETSALAKQKQELTHQLYTLYDRARVLNYAKKELNMTQAKVGQFKKINPSTQPSLLGSSGGQAGRLLLSEVEGSGETVELAHLQAIDIPETIEIETTVEEKNIIITQDESIAHDTCT